MASRHKQGIALLAALLAIPAAASSCNRFGCDPSPCLPELNLSAECAVSKNCEVDSEVVTSCECCGFTPHCRLWDLPPTGRLMIPLAEFWSTLGTRNDLRISLGWHPSDPDVAPDLTKAVFLLDGVAPTECTRTPEEIRCPNLSVSVGTLDFSYGDSDLFEDAPPLYIFISDQECDDAHPVCLG